MSPRRIAIAAGGTGGHVVPAIALANALMNLGSKVTLLHDGRVRHIVDRHLNIDAKEFAFGYGLSPALRFLKYILLIYNVLYILLWFSFQRPQMVIGFGGYVSAPALLAARLLLIKIAIVEQNSVLGRVNGAFYRCASVVFTAFEQVKGLPHSVKNLPIAMIAEEAFYNPDSHISLKKKNVKILVTGGSQGASSFADFVPKALRGLDVKLLKKLCIVMQVPQKFVTSTRNALEKLSLASFEVRAFFYDMAEQMKEADFLISRGGASTIAELCAAKKAAILIPYKYAKDNHQYRNVKRLADSGAAILLEEDENLAQNLEYWISELVRDEGVRFELGRSAANFYEPNNLRLMALIVGTIVP